MKKTLRQSRQTFTRKTRALLEDAGPEVQQLVVRLAYGLRHVGLPGPEYFTAEQWAAKVEQERHDAARAARAAEQAERNAFYSAETGRPALVTAPADWQPSRETLAVMRRSRARQQQAAIQ